MDTVYQIVVELQTLVNLEQLRSSVLSGRGGVRGCGGVTLCGRGAASADLAVIVRREREVIGKREKKKQI